MKIVLVLVVVLVLGCLFRRINDRVRRRVRVRVRVRFYTSLMVIMLMGCTPPPSSQTGQRVSQTTSVITYHDDRVEVWGRKGRGPGQFIEPRAVVADMNDSIYVVDSTGRIQKFTTNGKFVRQWTMPEIRDGKPESLGIDTNGDVLVPDTHYHRFFVYSPEGVMRRQWGSRGDPKSSTAKPGDFIFVNGATATKDGRIFTTEYGGSFARVQEFTRVGKFVRAFGSYGMAPGQFRRPAGPCIDSRNRLIVCDVPNHRLQVFDLRGKLLSVFGKPGRGPGDLSDPYNVAVDDHGFLYVAEWGNHRIQRFTADFQPAGIWGKGGTKPGEFYHPWGVAVDRHGYVYVADHENHRLQKFR